MFFVLRLPGQPWTLSICPLGLLVYLRCVTVRQGLGFLGPTREGRHCGLALLLVFSTYHLASTRHGTAMFSWRVSWKDQKDACYLRVYTCVGLQVLTCVCQCTWQEEARLPVRDATGVCLAFRDAHDPILSPLGDGMLFSILPILGPCKWLLFRPLMYHIQVVVTVIYCIPAPTWRGTEPASLLPYHHWPDSVWRLLWRPLGIHAFANSKVWLT